jgi:hypothetical protein
MQYRSEMTLALLPSHREASTYRPPLASATEISYSSTGQWLSTGSVQATRTPVAICVVVGAAGYSGTEAARAERVSEASPAPWRFTAWTL